MKNKSNELRNRVNQHAPKNNNSKNQDRQIDKATNRVMEYIKDRFNSDLSEYDVIHEKTIEIGYMINYIKRANLRREFEGKFSDRKIQPDGGIVYIKNKKTEEKLPILISEVKQQGTNDKRVKEGKKKQATGNAIERLGKNLTGIKAMFNHSSITPFICFGQGCDFKEDTVLVKVHVMNEFYPINKTFVFKKEGNSDKNDFSPVSMYFRENEWTEDEMFNIMKEIAETSVRYYIY